ncbi:MAG TPA: hypothetical protein VJB38_03485 [Bacteroidota bacterium]|nr:hypothetical protein [Bacteroidota bacterium]
MKTSFRSIMFFFLFPLVSVPLSAQTAGERTSVDLTVYNMNLALIREIRPLTLTKGLNTLVLPDIPATIDGTSLHFSSLTDPKSVRVLEQNFQYDLVHHAKLLEKYIGKQVEFVRYDQSTEKEYSVFGKLLATGWQQQPTYNPYEQYLPPPSYVYSGQMIAEINGKVEIAPTGRLVLPSLSEGLILKPQLQWLLNSTRPGAHNAEISYLATQLSWNSNYVVLLNQDDTRLDLTGWVTLTNNSGTSFKDAGLKLVAGDLNVIKTEADAIGYAKSMARVAEAPQFEQKELFEYKLYTLQRRTDLANNVTKQIELVSGKQVPSRKMFVYDGLADVWRVWRNNAGYRDQSSFGQQSNPKVGVFVSFKNSQNEGLGIPLPKGKIRVYKRDSDGKEQFIGEDQIDHTPKDEEIRLYLGNAFDLTGSRVQKNFRVVVSGHSVEETFEIKVKNHKDEAVEVMVYEHPWRWSEWDITKSNTEWEKLDQSTIRFPVKIEKNSEKVVSYTVRYTW